MNTINQHQLGLYKKFNVTRTDGKDAPGEKHEHDEYFVLNLTTDHHAIPALSAYADSCAADYPALAADLRKKAPASPKSTVPQLNESEIYAGAIIKPDGTGHHVILLDGDNDAADWDTQLAWAKSIGGDLPDRVEQSLLFAHLKDRFKEDWYWSNTQHAADSDCAWYQDFSYGYQYSSYKNLTLRARAVRRLAI